jgi:diguanylate cyclase (GGDEF)-like protein
VELTRTAGEQLASRLPAVALLVVTALGFLSWMPLSVSMPIREANAVFSSEWFPAVILGTLLIRVALAFIVLSMAKERRELEQRVDALTDALTGLPNRRALFEAADLLAQGRRAKAEPVSVLLFDLDHFKTTNDTYGHEVGDEVLKLFAATVSARLSGRSVVGRLGGEEFAAILPGMGPAAALSKAEAIRRAFAKSALVVDDLAIGATVSIGAASHMGGSGDLSALFRRADAALYTAKRAGRNRVELLGPDETDGFEAVKAHARSARRGAVENTFEAPQVKLSA